MGGGGGVWGEGRNVKCELCPCWGGGEGGGGGVGVREEM